MNIEFNYYYGKESDQFSFFKIPKLLFTDEVFKPLSSDAKVLYGILLDRMSLSMKNAWVDDENKVYIIFTIDEISEVMGCGSQKAIKILAELDTQKGIGLIEKKRLGLGKPNILYVKNFVINKENVNQELLKSQSQNSENHNSRMMNITKQELLKSQCNKTDINKTDINDTEFNNTTTPYPPEFKYEKLYENEIVEEVKEKIKSNICFDDLINYNFDSKPMLDVIVSVMEDVLNSTKDFRINGKLVKNLEIKDMYLSIRKNHIEYILDYLSKNKAKITNLRAYLIPLIYNAPLNVLGSSNTNRANHDLNDYYKNDKDVWREFLNGS